MQSEFREDSFLVCWDGGCFIYLVRISGKDPAHKNNMGVSGKLLKFTCFLFNYSISEKYGEQRNKVSEEGSGSEEGFHEISYFTP